jgi:hypothetical protein
MAILMNIELHYIDVTIHRIHSNCDSILVQVVNLYIEREEEKKSTKRCEHDITFKKKINLKGVEICKWISLWM